MTSETSELDEETTDSPQRNITLTINGNKQKVAIEDRQLLVEVIRGQVGLTGTHVGCYNGDCGACTLKIDGAITKSCLVLAASVDGAEITTVEGLADADGSLNQVQAAFWEKDAFQCGFCLPGQLFAVSDLLDEEDNPTAGEIRDALVGNLCRCTGYVNIVDAALDAAERRRNVRCGGAVGDSSAPLPCGKIQACTLHHD
jgi:carbon-monoxide dehydrogenase small subunit